ncbi:hypothetical protein Syun_001737 [Stephania yunnanensis]|uniref:Uncharacterized protein n=1 Tax=Stephania yunnanensis TaxID=152371 RepID=A0AAP0Q6K4_9MAGN
MKWLRSWTNPRNKNREINTRNRSQSTSTSWQHQKILRLFQCLYPNKESIVVESKTCLIALVLLSVNECTAF